MKLKRNNIQCVSLLWVVHGKYRLQFAYFKRSESSWLIVRIFAAHVSSSKANVFFCCFNLSIFSCRSLPPPPLSLFLSEFLIAIDCRLLCAHILHYAHVVHSICRNDSLFIKSLQMLDGVSLYAVKGISWRVTLCTEPLVKIKSFRFVHLNYMQKNDYK